MANGSITIHNSDFYENKFTKSTSISARQLEFTEICICIAPFFFSYDLCMYNTYLLATWKFKNVQIL